MSCCGEMRAAPLSPRHRMKVSYAGGNPVEVVDRIQVRLMDARDTTMIVCDCSFSIEGIVELAAAGGAAAEGGRSDG